MMNSLASVGPTPEEMDSDMLDRAAMLAGPVFADLTYPTHINQSINGSFEISHPDDGAILAFAVAMKLKMAKQRTKGYAGWQTCDHEELQKRLVDHVSKGDPVDVGNFAMMLYNMGARTALPTYQD